MALLKKEETAGEVQGTIVADAVDMLNTPVSVDVLEAASESDAVGEPEVGERVGRFKFTVRTAEATSESELRFRNRADALAAWLLAKWRREQGGNN